MFSRSLIAWQCSPDSFINSGSYNAPQRLLSQSNVTGTCRCIYLPASCGRVTNLDLQATLGRWPCGVVLFLRLSVSLVAVFGCIFNTRYCLVIAFLLDFGVCVPPSILWPLLLTYFFFCRQVAREARTAPLKEASDEEVERHRLAKMIDGLIDRKARPFRFYSTVTMMDYCSIAMLLDCTHALRATFGRALGVGTQKSTSGWRFTLLQAILVDYFAACGMKKKMRHPYLLYHIT